MPRVALEPLGVGDVARDLGGADHRPSGVWIGETVTDTLMRRPSFRMRTVS